MKANELMIGDWVNYSHSEDGIAPFVEPTRIVPEDLGRDEDVFETHYHPIPLTSEILEKNFNKKTFYGIFDDYFDFDIREYSDGIYIVTYHCCEMSLPDQCITLSFVHELQHFLNHCGIEKEIVLHE